MKYLSILIILFSISILHAQEGSPQTILCDTEFIDMDPKDIQSYKNYIENIARSVSSMDTIFIPVVIHNLTWNRTAYVSDSLLLNVVKNVNLALANEEAFYDPKGVDTRIRICLAKTDPDGNTTTGIVHKEHFMGNSYNLLRDQFDRNYVWDIDKYLNIFIIDGISGAASFPWDESGFQGITISSRYMNHQQGVDIFVHELGHYFGLYHTFQNTNCASFDCLENNDMVCDTPTDRIPFQVCFEMNTCAFDANPDDPNGVFEEDVPDMIENYMDGGICRSRFTEGQARRMHWALNEFRPELINDTENRCASCEPILVKIAKESGKGFVNEEFIVTSALVDQNYDYRWYLDDNFLGDQIVQGIVVDSPGVYLLRLEINDPDDTFCSGYWSYEENIPFKCIEDPSFEIPDQLAKDSCYSFSVQGIEEIDWMFEEQRYSGSEVQICPAEEGLKFLIIAYGEGNCSVKDSVLLLVSNRNKIIQEFSKKILPIPYDSFHTVHINNVKTINEDKYVILGSTSDNFFRDEFSDSTANFLFFTHQGQDSIECWSLKKDYERKVVSVPPESTYHYPSNAHYSIIDILQDGNAYYILGAMRYGSGANPILLKVNSFGQVEWSKELLFPKLYFLNRLESKYRLSLQEDHLIISILGTAVKVTKNGTLISSNTLSREPFGLYHNNYFYAVHSIYDEYNQYFINVLEVERDTASFPVNGDERDYSNLNIYNTITLGKIVQDSIMDHRSFQVAAENEDIVGSSFKMEIHPEGILLYWMHHFNVDDRFDHMIHHLVLFDEELNPIKVKAFKDENYDWETTDETNLSILDNEQIQLTYSLNRGETTAFLEFDKDFNITKKRFLSNEIDNTIDLSYYKNEMGAQFSNGYLFCHTAQLLPKNVHYITHFPTDSSYFSCNDVQMELEEIDFEMVESSQKDIRLNETPCSLEDIEVEIVKTYPMLEPVCVKKNKVEDYYLSKIDTVSFCPDSIQYNITICRNDPSASDQTNLLVFDANPLVDKVDALLERAVHFDSGTKCVELSYSGDAFDKFFLLNADPNYETPYTLRSNFFHGHLSMESNYGNNHLFIESGCDSMVSSTSVNNLSHEVGIYPNPATSQITISSKAITFQKVSIYTNVGKPVKVFDTNTRKFEISTEQLSSGVYLVKVDFVDGGSIWKKVILYAK